MPELSAVEAVLPEPAPPASFTGTSDEQAARRAAAARADKIERRIFSFLFYPFFARANPPTTPRLWIADLPAH
jgi:hypothetical protein